MLTIESQNRQRPCNRPLTNRPGGANGSDNFHPSSVVFNRCGNPVFTAPRSYRSKPCCRHPARSEEHTSELQSQSNLVCRLLLEKKKKKLKTKINPIKY